MSSLTFHWFLPTYGDSRHVVGGGHGVPTGSAGGERPATLGYLTQIARAAEDLGFEGALTPPERGARTPGSPRPCWPARPNG